MLARQHLARLIGEAMPPDPDVEEPLCAHTTTGRRLAAVLPGDDYERDYSRENLIDFRCQVYRWRRWHHDRARAAARRLLFETDSLDAPNLILLGQQVAEAFGIEYQPLRTWWTISSGGVTVIFHVIPHPSGLNRWWNDPANVRKCRKFLRGAIEERKLPDRVSGGPR